MTNKIDGIQYVTGTTYDPMGHITSITYPDTDVVNYHYDGAWNMYQVLNKDSSSSYATFPNYNALGQPIQIAFLDGANTTLSYETLTNRLHEMSTAAAGGTPQDLIYGYDNNGNILSITDNAVPNNSQSFTYDGLNRLLTAQSQSYSTVNISYDDIGNITSNSRVGAYAYNSGKPHAATSAGTNTYGYDANGNMTSQNGTALTYDYDNRLTSFGSTSFVYDYTGARVTKSTGSTYVGKLYEINNGTVTKHIFAGGRRVASNVGGSIYYLHPDHLGGLNFATNSSGVQQSVYYYPYGETRSNTGSIDLHHKFTDQENDPETSLYYYGARYYNPVLARFTSADSTVQSPGDPQTLNRYAYCRNNPLMYTDPSGHLFGIDDLLLYMIIGAATSATMAAIQGQNIGLGALQGALSAGIFCAAGGVISSMGLLQGVEAGSASAIAEASAIHFIAGAACGAINSALSGGNVGLNALEGGVSAGVAYGAGAELGMMPGTTSGWFSKLNPAEQFVSGIAFHTTVGSLTGGVTAELAGGKFVQGMGQGAWTAAYGFIFNEAGALLDDGFPRTIPADANPDTYRPYDEGQAWATAVNDPNFKLQMAGIMALPLVPLTVAALPEVYAGVLLYPETVFIGAGFAEGITPPLSGVSVNAYGYAAGVAASNYLPKGMIGP